MRNNFKGAPLRNYIFTRAMQYRAFLFDNVHAPQGDFPVYAIGRDDTDLQSQIEAINEQLISTLPAGWTYEFTYPGAMTIYFLLDKDSLMTTFQAFAAQYVSDAVANQPPAFPILVNPPETPRNTGWTDPGGVKRKPTPSDKGSKAGSFSGAATLLSIVQQWQEIADKLKTSKDSQQRRLASELQYLVNQVMSQRMSITEAIAALDAFLG